MDPIQIRVLPIDQLTPAPYNPRKILNPRSPAYRKLKQSLENFGLVEPLIWNERTGHIVGGHARLRILKELGIKDVPVSVVDLSNEREKALNVMLNNLEAQGSYDPKLLLELLEPLHGMPEYDMTGFDLSMLETLKFDPDKLIVDEYQETERVEITLATDKETLKRMQSRLDELIKEFDLGSHIRTGF